MQLYQITYENGVTSGMLYVATNTIESAVKCYRETIEKQKPTDSVRLISIQMIGNCVVAET